MNYGGDDSAAALGSRPSKRRQPSSSERSNGKETMGSVMARPCSDAKGHTGYLTFARLKCL